MNPIRNFPRSTGLGVDPLEAAAAAPPPVKKRKLPLLRGPITQLIKPPLARGANVHPKTLPPRPLPRRSLPSVEPTSKGKGPLSGRRVLPKKEEKKREEEKKKKK